MAKQAPSIGPGALLGFRLSEYQGNWTLTSTPLAAICQISAAEVPGRSADDAVVRQGLKKCTLREATVDEIVRGLQDKETAQVKARLCPLTDEDIFHTNFVYDDMKFRLYVAFYGDACKFCGSLWTDSIVTLFGKTKSEINEMWEACDPDSEDHEASRRAFLGALNAHANKFFTITVVAKLWVPGGPVVKKARTTDSATGPVLQYSFQSLAHCP